MCSKGRSLNWRIPCDRKIILHQSFALFGAYKGYGFQAYTYLVEPSITTRNCSGSDVKCLMQLFVTVSAG